MIINKFIIHVLDKNSDFPVLNGVENSISPETIKSGYVPTISCMMKHPL